MADRIDAPVLIAQTGPLIGQRWNLGGPALTIGRGGHCDLVVADRQVSREHVRITREEHAFWIEDLDSKNGTHVNGQRLAPHAPQRLQDGDVIQVALAIQLVFVGSEATVPLIGGVGEARLARRLRIDQLARRVWIGDREVDPPLSVPQIPLVGNAVRGRRPDMHPRRDCGGGVAGGEGRGRFRTVYRRAGAPPARPAGRD